jgi:exosome complex component RRP4
VQSIHSGDGSVSLHTRSLKYGKLAGGQLVEVPADLVKRQRQHFITLDTIGARCTRQLRGLGGCAGIAGALGL